GGAGGGAGQRGRGRRGWRGGGGGRRRGGGGGAGGVQGRGIGPISAPPAQAPCFQHPRRRSQIGDEILVLALLVRVVLDAQQERGMDGDEGRGTVGQSKVWSSLLKLFGFSPQLRFYPRPSHSRARWCVISGPAGQRAPRPGQRTGGLAVVFTAGGDPLPGGSPRRRISLAAGQSPLMPPNFITFPPLLRFRRHSLSTIH